MVCFAVKTAATVAKNVAKRAMRVNCKVNSEGTARNPNNELKLTLKLHEGEPRHVTVQLWQSGLLFLIIKPPKPPSQNLVGPCCTANIFT